MIQPQHTGWWSPDRGVHQRWWGGKLLTLQRTPAGWWLTGHGGEAVNAGRTLKQAKLFAATMMSGR